MAHKEQRDFCLKVKEKFPEYFRNKKVLDIGSLDINGSNRDLFEDCNYLGLDVGEGKNVDLVCVGHLFDGPDNYFDTIISTEVFEHDMYYEDTIKNIMRMLKPGGLFLFTCAAPGRPEHGTRRQGEWCAPLLLQISEEWADYYKNLEEKDVRKISSFNETFPDCYFELNNIHLDIPADLYFYGVKGGEKYLTNDVVTTLHRKDWLDHVFVIDCWPDNESKENDLLRLIKVLKTYNIDIVLSGHYPIKPEIQKMVDYYIFDKNNPLLYDYEFNEYGVNSGRWTEIGNYKIVNSYEFHHDYAIWETMRNTFSFCKHLNKKYIHFFEYDNIPHDVQYRQSFMEKIQYHDAILYEYHQGSVKDPHFSQFCATFIFSIKTDIALKVIEQIKNKYDYFTNKPKGWQLERVFLDCLFKVTNNIKISEYIANNNELNTQAVWNRDGMNMNGAIFQSYLGVDNDGQLYLHLISGFHEKEAKKDYLIEVNYGDYKKFILIRKKDYILEKIGEYKKGNTVKIYYQGVLVFKEFLGKNFLDFKKINHVFFKDKPINVQPTININFVDGPYVEIKEENENTYEIEFINNKNNQLVYRTKIKNGWWTKASIKYFINWKIRIKNEYGFSTEYNLDLKDKRVFICFESKSLGDNIAWMPYVEKFKEVHNCKIICSTFQNQLFKNQYNDIEFVEPGETVNNIHALYRIGLFLDENRNIRTEYHPNNPRPLPLTKIASDILGLDYEELKPKLPLLKTKKLKRVSIGIHSTAQCKYWNNPNGWQEVVDYLNEKGYEVRLLSREGDGYMGNKHPKGIIEHPKGNLEFVLKALQESELFIGLSSGLSWLAWGANVPTILISGFTDDDLEPKNGITRVINKDVCHGCWSKYPFDAGDWNWCPEHKGTDRQFECSKTIKSSDVILKINEILNIK